MNAQAKSGHAPSLDRRAVAMIGGRLVVAMLTGLVWLSLGVSSAFAAGVSISSHGTTGIVHPTIVLVEWSPSDWSPSYPFNNFGYQFGKLSDGTGVEKFFTDLNDSNYANMLSQLTNAPTTPGFTYGHADEFTVAPLPCTEHDPANGQGQSVGTRMTDATFQAVIENCIAAHRGDPVYQPSPSTIYMLYLPEKLYANVGNSAAGTPVLLPEGACGYHRQTTDANYSSPIIYGVISSPAGNPYCIIGSTFEQSVIAIQAHELFEAITDPDGNTGWYAGLTLLGQSIKINSDSEIADLCWPPHPTAQPLRNVKLSGTTYVLPEMWTFFRSFVPPFPLIQGCEVGTDFAQISANFTGAKGTNGWFTSPGSVSWDVSPTGGVAIKSGCTPSMVSGDGVHTLHCIAQGTSDATPMDGSTTIKVDTTPPRVGQVVRGSPFLEGQTFSSDNTCRFPPALVCLTPNAADPVSGIATSACNAFTTTVTGNFIDFCYATNGAGLTAVGDLKYTVVAVPANLVSDGSFETPQETSPLTTISAPGAIGPWSVTAGSVDIEGSSVWTPADGSQSIDLAGNSSGTISQTFTLPATGTYDLTYDYAGNPLCAPVTKEMQVSITEGAFNLLTTNPMFNTAGRTTTSMGWATKRYSFFGTARQPLTVEFKDESYLTNGGSPTSCGMALDNVAVTAQ